MGLDAESDPLRAETYIKSEVIAACYKSQPWYEAYMAALFEADSGQIGKSIRRAEVLIVNREIELFSRPCDRAEQHALNNALQARRALQRCLRLQSGLDPESTR